MAEPGWPEHVRTHLYTSSWISSQTFGYSLQLFAFGRTRSTRQITALNAVGNQPRLRGVSRTVKRRVSGASSRIMIFFAALAWRVRRENGAGFFGMGSFPR